MRDKAVGEIAAIKGKHDYADYYLFAMKNKDYIVKLITTYGLLFAQDGTKESVRYVRDNSQLNE